MNFYITKNFGKDRPGIHAVMAESEKDALKKFKEFAKNKVLKYYPSVFSNGEVKPSVKRMNGNVLEINPGITI